MPLQIQEHTTGTFQICSSCMYVENIVATGEAVGKSLQETLEFGEIPQHRHLTGGHC